MSILLNPNKNKLPWLYNIRKSAFVLKNLKVDKDYQEQLNFLVRINEQNIGLQKISFNSNYNYNTSIFKKGNPFFFMRNNYKRLFCKLLRLGFLTPNILKYLHIAYWPTNSNEAWRTYYEYHGLERKQRINYVENKINKLTYLFALIFKKNYMSKILNFKSYIQSPLKNKYFNKLKYFYHLNINKLKFQEEFLLKSKKKKNRL